MNKLLILFLFVLVGCSGAKFKKYDEVRLLNENFAGCEGYVLFVGEDKLSVITQNCKLNYTQKAYQKEEFVFPEDQVEKK